MRRCCCACGTPTPTNYTVTRNAGLGIFLPTEDEWYKAAYYDAATTSYFDWPTGTDAPTTCTTPGPTPNTANCNNQGGNDNPITGGAFTDVGAYTGSASPYGTFDQGGDVYEYTEGLTSVPPAQNIPPPPGPAIYRVLRGTSAFDAQADMAAYTRRSITNDTNFSAQGFRIVQVVPEPGTGLLVITGLLTLAARRRRLVRPER